MHVTGLFIYPVKSLRGCAVARTAVDDLGLVDDRRFMVVDETGRFLTQRAVPRMATITTALTATTLQLSAHGAGEVRVPRERGAGSALRVVSVWSSEGLLADDCGEEPAGWLSDVLGLKCRLVQIGPGFTRPIKKPGKARADDRVMFADAYPLLVISEGSLRDLNDRLAERGEAAVPMNRFRPNVVVTGCEPFAEDGWGRFRIGEAGFRTGGPCARCSVTTTDQLTGERGAEPLRTLASYRRDAADPTSVNFGQNLFLETKSGTLRVGDRVELL